MRILRLVAMVWMLVVLLFPGKAYCYLDPGTGSYVLQVAGAIVLGALFSLKTLWKKIRSFISRLK